jgi:hypothetical protein
MAASSLTPFELERRRLRATKTQLDRRWTELSNLLSAILNRSGQTLLVDAEYQAEGVWTGLQGVGVERIERNRGGVATVVSFATLPAGLAAWLGYQEVWDRESGRAPFSFRQAGLTVHVGEVSDPVKPQLLRLEWPGLRNWDRSGVGFQSPGAGHPHWQVDLFESLDTSRQPSDFEPEPVEAIEDFGAVAIAPSLGDRIASLTFERMHLASAAPWWSERPAEFKLHHLNAPSNAAALSRWLSEAISYVRQELSRCVMRR